jgi:hypothetical protein
MKYQNITMNQQGCECGNNKFHVFNDGKDIMIIACSNCGNGLKFTSHGNIKIEPVKDVHPERK